MVSGGGVCSGAFSFWQESKVIAIKDRTKRFLYCSIFLVITIYLTSKGTAGLIIE
jgi:hypothetical protein